VKTSSPPDSWRFHIHLHPVSPAKSWGYFTTRCIPPGIPPCRNTVAALLQFHFLYLKPNQLFAHSFAKTTGVGVPKAKNVAPGPQGVWVQLHGRTGLRILPSPRTFRDIVRSTTYAAHRTCRERAVSWLKDCSSPGCCLSRGIRAASRPGSRGCRTLLFS